eukprot:Nk52_evm33s2474 gene=Nk52_evmTU33s2474
MDSSKVGEVDEKRIEVGGEEAEGEGVKHPVEEGKKEDEEVDSPTVSTSGSPTKRPRFGNRHLVDKDRVFEHNAWDNVEWDEEMIKRAGEIVEKQKETKIPDERYVELEEKADFFWDEFYKKHENRFFKNRNWLFTEFPELVDATDPSKTSQSMNIFEIGCGVGNTVFPILQKNQENKGNLHVYACDFSETAVGIVQEHELYSTGHCTAFQCDFSSESSTTPIKEGSLDIAIMIFVLSAISPSRMQFCIERISNLLKPGGKFIFRDYGRYDMAQLRFKKSRFLSENFYARGDGTRVYFFSQEEIKDMCEGAGMLEEQNHFDKRLIVNRREKKTMYRSWLQCKYIKTSQ